MGDKTASFGIQVKAESNADTVADTVESLRGRILASQEAVKNYGSSLRQLRGNTDEVKAAKLSLKTATDAERNSISQGVLALGKLNTTLAESDKVAKQRAAVAERQAAFDEVRAADKDKLTKRTAADEVRALKALNAAKVKYGSQKDMKSLGELEKAYHKHQSVKTQLAKQEEERLKSQGGAVREWMSAFGVAGTTIPAVMAGVVAAVMAVGAAIAYAGVSLAKFIIEEGSALRTMGLFREAATGSATNALHFGHQIDELGGKVSQTRAELNDLSLSLSRSLVRTRITGQGIVDTFNAVAQATDAMGQEAGNAIRGIVERSKMMGRMGLGLLELQGTGISFQDVAAELARGMKGGIDEARNMLVMGRVDLSKGAAALRAAVEKKFAGINLRKMLDINVIGRKFKDTLASLTSGVDLTPLLGGLQGLVKMFDANTTSGKALKTMITNFGDGVVKSFSAALPYIQVFFNQLVIEGLKLQIAWEVLKTKLTGVFGKDFLEKWLTAETVIKAARITVYGAVGAFTMFAAVLGAAALAVYGVYKPIEMLVNLFLETDWKGIGTSILDGIGSGIMASWANLKNTVIMVASGIRKAFAGELEIQSPSKVFRRDGQDIGKGAELGIGDATPGVQRAAANMAPTPPNFGGMMGAAGGGGNSGPISVNVSLEFPNATNGKEVAATLTGEDFKAKLTKTLEELMRSIGAQTQVAPGAVT